jgi:hypothetical protein
MKETAKWTPIFFNSDRVPDMLEYDDYQWMNAHDVIQTYLRPNVKRSLVEANVAQLRNYIEEFVNINSRSWGQKDVFNYKHAFPTIGFHICESCVCNSLQLSFLASSFRRWKVRIVGLSPWVPPLDWTNQSNRMMPCQLYRYTTTRFKRFSSHAQDRNTNNRIHQRRRLTWHKRTIFFDFHFRCDTIMVY